MRLVYAIHAALVLSLATAVFLSSCADGGDSADDGTLQVATTVAPITSIAANIGGSDIWMAGQLLSNQSGTVATPFGGVAVAAGSDVLTLRGFFEIAPMFTDPTSDIGTSTVTIRESNAGDRKSVV